MSHILKQASDQLDRCHSLFISLFFILTADSGSVICMRRMYAVRLCKPTATSALMKRDVNNCQHYYGFNSSFKLNVKEFKMSDV